MGFMGFGKSNDGVMDVKVNDVKQEIAVLEVEDAKLTLNLEKIGNQINLKLQQGSDPSLRKDQREKFALDLTALRDQEELFKSSLAGIRLRLRKNNQLSLLLERRKGYKSSVQKAIAAMDPDLLEEELTQMAMADQEELRKYDQVIQTGEIYTKGQTFQLDVEISDAMAELEALSKQKEG